MCATSCRVSECSSSVRVGAPPWHRYGAAMANAMAPRRAGGKG